MKPRRAAFLAGFILSLLVVHGTDGIAAKGGIPGDGAKEKKAVPDATVVARWGGKSVTASELKQYVINRAGFAVRHGGKVTPEAVRGLLQEMIGQRILAAASLTPDVLSDPRYAGTFALASTREVADRYVSQVLREKFAVSDEEVAAGMPKRGDVVRIKQLIVKTREEAQEVLEKIRGGMAFDEAVETYSTVKTAPGTFVDIREDYDLFDQAGREEVWNLPEGGLSGIIPTKVGFCVALVVEKRMMDDSERNALAQALRNRLFEKKATRYYEEILRGVPFELFEKELMMAAGQDFEFEPSPHRLVMRVAGDNVYFDEYTRTREVHLRDMVKARTAQDLFRAYKVEFENLAVTAVLAKTAAKEKGWAEVEGDRRDKIRDSIAMKVFGENLFRGIAAGDEEVRKEYDGNKGAFTIKNRYKVRRLTFPSLAEANKFRKSVKSPEEFYKRLRQRETKSDRYENTFSEWKDLDRQEETLKKALAKTKKGKLTEPLDAGKGKRYLYFVDDIEKNYRTPFEEVRVNIKRTLLRRKQEAKLAEFVNGEIGKLGVEFHESPIRKVAEQINERKKHAPAP